MSVIFVGRLVRPWTRLLCPKQFSTPSFSTDVAGEPSAPGSMHHHSPDPVTPPPSKHSRGGRSRWEEDSEDGRQVRYRNPWKLKLERYRRHISNLVKKSRQAEAVEVLEQMKRARVRPDVGVYNTILSGYGKEGDVKRAFKIFNEMKKRALLPTDHTYSSMLAACGSAGPSGSLILDKVMAEMERRDVRPNTIATNALISALALCDRQQEAMQVYLDMAKTYTEPDLCTFGALLLAVGKDRTRGLEVAMRVWSEMLASGLKPDLHSYNMALQVLRDAGLEGVVREESCVSNAHGEPLKRSVPTVPIGLLKGGLGTAGNAEGVGATRTGVAGREEAGATEGGRVSRPDELMKVRAEGERAVAADGGEVSEAGSTEGGRVSRPDEVMKVRAEEEGPVAAGGEVSGYEVAKRSGASSSETKERTRKQDLEWVAGKQVSKSELFVRGKIEFVLSESHSLVLHVGSTKPEGLPVVRWLEKGSIEDLFASMKQNKVKPNVHTFQLLMHLTLDPVHLLVTMRERKVPLDNRLMAAAITQQAKQFRNLRGAKVFLQYSRDVGLDLGQVGYQAIASGCQYRRDGMQLLMKMNADSVQPNQHVMGTLIGHAVRDHNYEYLTSLVKIMMQLKFRPNLTIQEMLETAANRKVKSPLQQKRLNGFKGFYSIWKRVISPPNLNKEEQYALE